MIDYSILIQIMGYTALVLIIIAVSMTQKKSYRIIHLISSVLYLFIGLINAIPIA